jgi:lactoylglutathione lyase
MQLQYLGIRVTNLDRSLKFYTLLLGLKEKRRGDNTENGGGIWVLLEDPASNQKLELNWYPNESSFSTEYSPGEGLDHIGFIVDDVEETFEQLVSKGATPTEINPSKTKGWAAFVEDPDGNWIEIFQKTEPRKKN